MGLVEKLNEVKDKLDDIKKSVERGEINLESSAKDFINIWGKIVEISSDFETILGRIWQLKRDRTLGELLNKVKKHNLHDRFLKLKEIGEKMKRNNRYSGIVDDLNKLSYRIIESARHGKRDEVMYMVVRVFCANRKEIPSEVSEIFSPRYSDEEFRLLFYSFFSGILKEEREGGGG